MYVVVSGKTKRASVSENGEQQHQHVSRQVSAARRPEISAPIVLQSCTLNESQTLPRPVKQISQNLISVHGLTKYA